jgi:hypothetical protein
MTTTLGLGLQNDTTHQDRHNGNRIQVTKVNNDKDKDDNDDDGDDVDDPTVEAHVALAKVPRKYCMSISASEVYLWTFIVYNSIHPEAIAAEIEQPDFIDLIQQFIYDQQHPDHASESSSDVSAPVLPKFYGKIAVYSSAVATFHAPSDISGVASWWYAS